MKNSQRGNLHRIYKLHKLALQENDKTRLAFVWNDAS